LMLPGHRRTILSLARQLIKCVPTMGSNRATSPSW
jgi:hypothetical protein